MSSRLASLILNRTVSQSLHADVTINVERFRQLSTDAGVPPVEFANPNMYTKKTGRAQAIFKDVIDFSAKSGLDKAGAYQVVLDSGLHTGSTRGGDTFNRSTGGVTNKAGQKMYFYRNDGTFWERIHFPDSAVTEFDDHKFVEISEEDFNNKTHPVNPKFD